MERSPCILGFPYKHHRKTWEGVHGGIPKGKIIMHLCDNPACYNIEHLVLGTYKANTQDMLSKGRHRVKHGEGHYNSVLTREQVAAIRNSYKPRDPKFGARALARKYNVSHMSISRVIRGVSWKEKF
jgi:hypothetical protein